MNEHNHTTDGEVPVIDGTDATLAPTLTTSGDGEAAQPEGSAFIAEEPEVA